MIQARKDAKAAEAAAKAAAEKAVRARRRGIARPLLSYFVHPVDLPHATRPMGTGTG
jgi:hypothetical protein